MGKVASAIGMLLAVKLLTKYLSIEQFGEFVLGLTVSNFITQLVMGPLGQGVGRYYIEAQKKAEIPYFWISLKKLFFNSLIVTLLFSIIIWIGIIKLEIGIGVHLAILALILGYINGLNDIFSSMHNLAMRRFFSIGSVVFELYLRLALIFGATLILHAEQVLVMYIYIASGVIVILMHIHQKHKIQLTSKSIQKKSLWNTEIVKLTINASFWGVFVWMLQASDKWVLYAFTTKSDIARYAVMYQLAYVPVTMLFGIINSIIVPIIYKSNGGNFQQKSTLRNILVLIFCLGCMFYITFNEYVMEIIAGNNYIQDSKLMVVFFASAFLYSVGDLYSIKNMGSFDFKKIRNIKIITACVGISLNYIGAYKFGVEGVIYSLLIYSLLYMLISMYLNRINSAI